MNTLVMGVMSHNHPESVKDVLALCADIYRACEVDVYYYDSSENDEIRDIIVQYQTKGYHNLFYVGCKGMGPDQKPFKIWSGYGMEKEYDYHWVVKDRTAVDSATFLSIYKMALFDRPDMIVIDTYGDHSQDNTHMESNPLEIYRDYAWEMTSMDTVIVRKDRFVTDNFYGEKHFREMDPRKAFSHYDTYFRRLAEMDAPRIGVLSEPLVKLLNSTKSGSEWEKGVFHIWGDFWVSINELLPEMYSTYKSRVIKSEAVPIVLRTEEGLEYLRRKGTLNPGVITPKLQERWDKISDVPFERLVSIAQS